MKTYVFREERKDEFLGGLKHNEMARKINMGKGNLSNILNRKTPVSLKYAYFLTGISNVENDNSYDTSYFFEEYGKEIEKND